jgi:hypothetical protein
LSNHFSGFFKPAAFSQALAFLARRLFVFNFRELFFQQKMRVDVDHAIA